MRKDQGVSGDAQRIEQLGWMISLKIIDDKDKELELLQENYKSVIPQKLQWRNWAANAEGMTGDELKDFVDRLLFPGLRNIDVSTGSRRAVIFRDIFEGTNNYMKNGTIIRQVLNQLNQIDFNASDDRHVFGDIYENILKGLQSAGNYGEFYTPRAITEFMTETTNPRLGEKVLDPACGTGGFLTSAIENIRRQDVKNLEDLQTLEKTIHGMEFKPLPFMLSVTNLILHDIEVPHIDYTDSLNREYTSIGSKDRVDVILATNLIFFTKGEPTKKIWYWEHKLPEGVKSYSKTKPIQKSEFDGLKKWWGKRKPCDQAWQVSIDTLKANGYSLDIKNPHAPEEAQSHTSAELLVMLAESLHSSDTLLKTLKKELVNG